MQLYASISQSTGYLQIIDQEVVYLGVHYSNAGIWRAQMKIKYQITYAEYSQENMVLRFLLKPVKAIVLFSFQGKQICMFVGQLPKCLSHTPNKKYSKQWQLLHNVT